MFIKRKITLLLTTALLSTLLFACSESNQDELMTSNQEIGGEKNSIAPSLKGNDGSSSETSGGTLKRLWGDPPTLDPHLVTDTTSAGLVVEMFSGLVSLNSDLEIVPDLAESWDVSEGGTQYTFNLRDDIKFSDGSSVTAKDFLSDIVIKHFKPSSVIIGYDHHFGFEREGSPQFLRNFGKENGFNVDVIEPISDENVTISSTHIRNLIKEGLKLY